MNLSYVSKTIPQKYRIETKASTGPVCFRAIMHCKAGSLVRSLLPVFALSRENSPSLSSSLKMVLSMKLPLACHETLALSE